MIDIYMCIPSTPITINNNNKELDTTLYDKICQLVFDYSIYSSSHFIRAFPPKPPLL
jgi:hypothetical protein